MKIETTYGCGDRVFIMQDRRIETANIIRVEVEGVEDSPSADECMITETCSYVLKIEPPDRPHMVLRDITDDEIAKTPALLTGKLLEQHNERFEAGTVE